MKYDIMMSCGHIETVQIYGKADDRERKIRYFENYRTCKECYKQKMRERERKQGLLFHACIDPCVQQMDGDVYLLAWYSGDTITHKDEIKSFGYYWDGRRWWKKIKLQEFQEKAVQAASIGAKKTESKKPLQMYYFKRALTAQEEWYDIRDKISAVKKPERPGIVKGHYWNQNIYGRDGQYRIYLDDEETFISDEDAIQIKKYLVEKDEYSKKVEEIKSAHR